MFELELVRMPKSLNSAWFGLIIQSSQARASYQAQTQAQLRLFSLGSKKIALSNVYITKNQVNKYTYIYIYIYIKYNIIYSFYHASNNYDQNLFKLQLCIIKSIHHHLLSIASVIVQNTIFTSTFIIHTTIIFTNLNKLTFQNIYE